MPLSTCPQRYCNPVLHERRGEREREKGRERGEREKGREKMRMGERKREREREREDKPLFYSHLEKRFKRNMHISRNTRLDANTKISIKNITVTARVSSHYFIHPLMNSQK